jgi:hypothetical protein
VNDAPENLHQFATRAVLGLSTAAPLVLIAGAWLFRRRREFIAPVILTFLVGGWAALALHAVRPDWLGKLEFLTIERTLPFLIGLPVVAGSLLLFDGDVRRLNRSLPVWWLPAWQTGRVIGGLFLAYLYHGALPASFAIPSGIGDVYTGLTAPFVAIYAGRRQPNWRVLAVLWNLIGLLDLAVAVSCAIAAGVKFTYPLTLIPGFLVPMAIVAHIYSLAGLASAGAEGKLL